MGRINLPEEDINRVIEMAWEDRTSFDAIERTFGLTEQDVKDIMRANMKQSSWLMWRKRVCGRKTKHEAKRGEEVNRFKCSRQRTISLNKISKRKTK